VSSFLSPRTVGARRTPAESEGCQIAHLPIAACKRSRAHTRGSRIWLASLRWRATYVGILTHYVGIPPCFSQRRLLSMPKGWLDKARSSAQRSLRPWPGKPKVETGGRRFVCDKNILSAIKDKSNRRVKYIPNRDELESANASVRLPPYRLFGSRLEIATGAALDVQTSSPRGL